ncbi:hypothetical protein CLU79DRAFT_780290 [Phycomyces nitens]|nr:hypothetical protein CLU79DRAFT_780290 [Phycomyces nitens]
MVRVKSRWLLFEIVDVPVIKDSKVVFPHRPFNVSEEHLTRAVREAITVHHGDFGSGMAWNTSVKWFNPTTRTGIMRVGREYADLVIGSLFFVKQIHSIPASFSIIHSSGTLISAQKEAIERDRLNFLEN